MALNLKNVSFTFSKTEKDNFKKIKREIGSSKKKKVSEGTFRLNFLTLLLTTWLKCRQTIAKRWDLPIPKNEGLFIKADIQLDLIGG